jgi:hypothetical protein
VTIQYSDEVLDSLIAPGVSAFKTAVIPDMSNHTKESAHWISNYFLNSMLRAKFTFPMSAYAYNYLRRTQYAFKEHHNAREATLEFLKSKNSPSMYAKALFHWECFLSQSWHSYALLVSAWDGKAFEKNDGSTEQRLNSIYNQMKHVESRIESGQLQVEATVPVWLDNDGLRSIDSALSYAETAEILKDLAKYADALSDPLTAKDNLNELDKKST